MRWRTELAPLPVYPVAVRALAGIQTGVSSLYTVFSQGTPDMLRCNYSGEGRIERAASKERLERAKEGYALLAQRGEVAAHAGEGISAWI